MRSGRSPRFGTWRRSSIALVIRRLAVTALAVVLLAAAEVAATLSATSPHGRTQTRGTVARIHVAPTPYGGEPHVTHESGTPAGAHDAAVRFVRDYALWSAARVAAIPVGDASPRVIRLLERRGPLAGTNAGQASRSVRIARGGPRSFEVTSAIGNFLIAKRSSRWRVVSLPGD
jgi:hypothetical protein